MSVPVFTVVLNPTLIDNLGVKSSIESFMSAPRSPLAGKTFEIRFEPHSGLGSVDTAMLVGASNVKGIGPVRQTRLAALVKQGARVALRSQTVGVVDTI